MHRAPLPHRVFLHGAGRRGTAAWPSQDDPDFPAAVTAFEQSLTI
ncbi:hypothetical protein O5Y58_05540 [Microbacterium paraoxydans]